MAAPYNTQNLASPDGSLCWVFLLVFQATRVRGLCWKSPKMLFSIRSGTDAICNSTDVFHAARKSVTLLCRSNVLWPRRSKKTQRAPEAQADRPEGARCVFLLWRGQSTLLRQRGVRLFLAVVKRSCVGTQNFNFGPRCSGCLRFRVLLRACV